MKKYNESFASPMRDGQRGQSLVMVAILLPVLLGMAALVIDLGYAYASYQELLGATQAAALAGGATIPNPSGPTASTVAQQYSAAKVGPTKELNWHANLQNVSTSISIACVSPATYPTLGLPQCNVYPSCPSGCNMIQVTTTAKVPTFFAKIFGVANIPITATATAAARGGGIPPYHVMLVLDTTASMGPPNLDTGCTQNGTSVTPEQCAQFGVQTLLDQLHPCPIGLASCQINPGQPGSYLNPVDQVGLMVFPGLCSATGAGVTTGNCPVLAGPGGLTNTIANTTYASADYACPPTTIPQTSYNNNPEYMILGFQGNFRTSDTSPLNTNSNLFKAIGAGTNNCGVSTPANFYTFYAGAIQAAQDYLTQQNTTGVQNVIIFLSDGDANSPASSMAGHVVQANGPKAGLVYPNTNECQQAIDAATFAKNAGTIIYSISYGSELTGCSTDGGALLPCDTMRGISSLPLSQYFYSVPDASVANGTICSQAVPITALNQVFTTIAGQLTVSRLVPSGDF